jgi:UDP-N-acetyl-2-amino-2-deoxyglucuronate dehydrogenase
MMRFGILGAGMVAAYHRDAIAANHDIGAELVAVSTSHQARFPSVASAFGAPCVAARELMERDDIDVVCICTPSGLHAQQTLDAISAGKHVLVEKPFALSLEEADQVERAARQSRVRVGVALQRRTNPVLQSLADRIKSNVYGRITLATLTMPYHRSQSYYDQSAWRGTWDLDGGGVLMNQGIHLVDLLVWLLGDPISAEAHGATLAREIEAEDTLTATLRFEQGTLATISATTATFPGVSHRLELFGTDGNVRIEGEEVVASHPAIESAPAASAAASSPASNPRGISLDGHRRLIRDMVEAVQLERPPLVGPAEARRSLAAVLRIYETAGLRTG